VPQEFAAVVFAISDNPSEDEVIVGGERCIERQHAATCGDAEFELRSPA
jgi:hypothetical protein